MKLSLAALLLGCVSSSQVAMAQDEEPPRPNVIMIFADDVGYGDLSCYGNPYSETPNLCRLAEEGTQFHNFYVTGNVCPHSRAGLMTSRNPSWFPNYTSQYGFMGALTINNLLSDADYHTAHIGKWNIGANPEVEQSQYGIQTLRQTGSNRNDPFGREGMRFTHAMQFVEEHQDEPFYLNLWIYATHTPVNPQQQFVDRYKDIQIDYSKFGGQLDGIPQEKIHNYLADLWQMDINIGRLLDHLDRLGMAENTIVAFTSDNGPDIREGKIVSTLSDNV